MKAAAAICFAATGIWTGLFLRGRLEKRVQILVRLCSLLREIENRTAILHISLPQTVQALAESESFCSLSFLKDCTERFQAGASFPHAWNTAVTAFLCAKKLRGDGAQMLPQFGASLTCVNDAQIERLIGLYLQYLQADLQQARHCLQTTGRLDVYLCAGGGILLGIMVL